MKREITTSFLVLTVLTAFSQDLGFEVKGAYAHPILAGKLVNAAKISDLIDGYPVSWIAEYVSTGISVASGDIVNKAISTDDNLTPEQVSLLKNADLGDDVVIDVAYKSSNFITKELDMRYIHYAATVVPEHEAHYPGGPESMRSYLKESAINKIRNETFKAFQQAVIRFTVDEHGQIANPRVTTTSGDTKTDNLLLKALKNMPKWKPALNSAGASVTQDFEFIVGNTGC